MTTNPTKTMVFRFHDGQSLRAVIDTEAPLFYNLRDMAGNPLVVSKDRVREVVQLDDVEPCPASFSGATTDPGHSWDGGACTLCGKPRTTTNPTPASLSPEREAAARQQIADLVYGTYGQFDHHRTYVIADTVMPAVRAAVAAENARLLSERQETNGKLVERDVALRAAEKRIAELEGGALTVFRARRVIGDRGATLGHYRTREQAQARCIAALRNESPTLVPDVIFSWVGVDGTEVLGVSTPTEPCPDVTDYVVTEITVTDATCEAEVR